jgi:hypothetical protein
MKCFYHSADLDGICSGAIIYDQHPECEMIGINYGDDFPWNTIMKGEKVFMVDFSLQPFPQMIELNGLADLIWIDHHKTAIEDDEILARQGTKIKGHREIGMAGCELCWNWLHDHIEIPIPPGVALLGRYDVWDKTNPQWDAEILPFQFGMRLESWSPKSEEWKDIFNGDTDPWFDKGKTVLQYQTSENKKYAATTAFETEIDGHPVIAINKGLTNSQLFDSVWDREKYHAMLAFYWKKKRWMASLYSDRDDIDVSVIAKAHGGGGHKGAAGFTCDKLPFDIGSK